MICEVQWAKLLDVSVCGQVTAETPSCFRCVWGLKKNLSVVACSVPDAPRSTSASAPLTPLLICVSMPPWKAGVAANGPFQILVWKSCHESALSTIVPSEPIVMAGSLSPLGCSNGVLVNEMVLGCAPAGALARCVTNAKLTVSMTASATRPSKPLGAFVILASFLSFILCLRRSGHFG